MLQLLIASFIHPSILPPYFRRHHITLSVISLDSRLTLSAQTEIIQRFYPPSAFRSNSLVLSHFLLFGSRFM